MKYIDFGLLIVAAVYFVSGAWFGFYDHEYAKAAFYIAFAIAEGLLGAWQPK